ncbi:Aldehyde dehydrogenase, dimeric NADP-preferring [Smittium mucronatum]|uniref:Aldehyde dehydrogenase n=1 Tax=Smittium mucronatum TaxID=133383 RepID=A0A1R0GXG0_9FUNG|nr:Aldehyde dehydrogenase, dimeric NADP-preferring [Smittium mucronatum]
MENSNLEYTDLNEIPKIVEDLRLNFISGITLDIEFRKSQLRALHALMSENRGLLCEALHKDLNKNEVESLFSEIDGIDFEIGQMLENMDEWLKPEITDTGSQPAFLNSKFEIRKVPHGMVFMISPWNYPVRLALLPLIGAIATGNVIVMKQSEVSVHTTVLLTKLLSKYMDKRILRLINGGVKETSLLLEQKADHIFYTGSGSVGKIVARAAANQLCKLTLELGGKCPVIVTNISKSKNKLDVIARRLVWGKLLNSGQTCLASDYLLVDQDIHKQLLASIAKAILDFYGQNPKNSPDYCKIINIKHFERIFNLVKGSSADMAVGDISTWDKDELFIPPTVMDDVKMGDSLMDDELFGPILPIMKVNSTKEIIQIINSYGNPLAIYLFTDDNSVRDSITRFSSSGSIIYNDTMMHAGCHTTPFGGVGSSGTGSYLGRYSITNFSHLRTVMFNSLDFPPENIDSLRFPPYSGSQNLWKKQTGKDLLYPTSYYFRSNVLGKLFTYIPFWRVLQVVPHFIASFFRKN